MRKNRKRKAVQRDVGVYELAVSAPSATSYNYTVRDLVRGAIVAVVNLYNNKDFEILLQ